MNKLFATLAVAMLGMLGGCASQPTAGDSSAASGGSGITIFGTIDAAVSGTRNSSGR
ncbi:MAG: hypothetical protein KKC79_02395 [Gammaproteobacteria bacterium]|nr:hypothetical protein [Gammaproteobacteria bacterium]MBU1442406.1 hypothetical protein [Gammaproteobacteria bacterium]MBU2284852.1 hypothetical protein [Gammaproteobacteria bacterium]MBU2407481.1 hypothetical protein [Gammaproteobacteria bacterium]